MNIDKIKRVYLLGIGGIGMSGLARYFSRLGCEVAGYDRTSTELTQTLEAEGMPIIYTDDVAAIPAAFEQAGEETLVIFTPAIPADLALKAHFIKHGHELYKRSRRYWVSFRLAALLLRLPVHVTRQPPQPWWPIS